MKQTNCHDLLQIGYVSTAVHPQSPAVMHAVLATSRRNNLVSGITGLLIAGGQRYLQILEGPAEPLEHLIRLIEADFRHEGCIVFLRRSVASRSFPGWSMAFRGDPKYRLDGDFLNAVQEVTSEMEEGRLKQQIIAFAKMWNSTRSLPGAPVHSQAA